MRRFLALVVAAALVSASVSAASLHVHEYLDHDHPEHHHGPASHHHPPGGAADLDHDSADDGHHLSVEAASCDAGRHVAAVRTACASVPRVHVDLAEVPGPSFAILATPGRCRVRITDTRVHGPPFLRQLPARAPPVRLPA